MARDAALDVDAPDKTQMIGDGCLRCGAPGATMTLLTSMTRYFMCDRCECRWQVSRLPGVEQVGH